MSSAQAINKERSGIQNYTPAGNLIDAKAENAQPSYTTYFFKGRTHKQPG